MEPLISVVIATRNRPALFAQALDSVLAQGRDDVEIIVVDDGSSAESLAAYQAIWDAAARSLGESWSLHRLVERPRGHGPSYALNTGAAHARGGHLCFLDDDDRWTDPAHLGRVARAIGDAAAQGRVLDLYMGNQEAWIGERSLGLLWLGGLAPDLQARGRRPDEQGRYEVTVADLLRVDGFCHLNVFTIRRELYERVGGMDEGIRWEQDRKLYLDLIEPARLMIHHPAVVARHHVPDPGRRDNVTTRTATIDKRLYQTLVMDRVLARSAEPAIRRHARLHKSYALKKIALEFADGQDWVNAQFYAWQALGAGPGLKWFMYCIHCHWHSWNESR
ncbi:MAG: glycosyltransferase family 2 protein [Burkholderiales bacterium]|nr:glycosyltransferase family 2 protein [Burkholderiales bacterium]MDE1925774.1 glycosyltransferase family 2 protein [Burkholderiales bacterium]MDE2160855.1 glycosyltransferase family 2 protein [Burkholderiales bacterium]